MEHTTIPWKAGDELYGGEDYPVRCIETGQMVAMVYTGPDAAFIVHAVNNFEALTEALRTIHHHSQYMDNPNEPITQRGKIQLLAEAALKVVEP